MQVLMHTLLWPAMTLVLPAEAAFLLGRLIQACPTLTRPYFAPVLRALVAKLRAASAVHPPRPPAWQPATLGPPIAQVRSFNSECMLLSLNRLQACRHLLLQKILLLLLLLVVVVVVVLLLLMLR